MSEPADAFLTTRWTMVLRAGSAAADSSALEELCRAYWRPLFHFARLQGLEQEDARDAVQDFFADLLQRNYLDRADAEKGRFRSFLIGSFKHQLFDAHDKRSARKRGGGVDFIPLDALTSEPADAYAEAQSPELSYDRQWAMTVLASAAERLRTYMQAEGHGHRLQVLEPFLVGSTPGMSYARAGTELGVDADRVRTWIHRLRQRRARFIREVVAETVADPADVDAEIRHLLDVVAL